MQSEVQGLREEIVKLKDEVQKLKVQIYYMKYPDCVGARRARGEEITWTGIWKEMTGGRKTESKCD